jgi:hypothetical protein
VLVIRVSTLGSHPGATAQRVQAFTAVWNSTARWPKAYVHQDRDVGVRVIGENCCPLAQPIHRQLVHTLIDTTIGAGNQLFIDLAGDLATPTAEELETWFGEWDDPEELRWSHVSSARPCLDQRNRCVGENTSRSLRINGRLKTDTR